jgi:hypothetical protein
MKNRNIWCSFDVDQLEMQQFIPGSPTKPRHTIEVTIVTANIIGPDIKHSGIVLRLLQRRENVFLVTFKNSLDIFLRVDKLRFLTELVDGNEERCNSRNNLKYE